MWSTAGPAFVAPFFGTDQKRVAGFAILFAEDRERSVSALQAGAGQGEPSELRIQHLGLGGTRGAEGGRAGFDAPIEHFAAVEYLHYAVIAYSIGSVNAVLCRNRSVNSGRRRDQRFHRNARRLLADKAEVADILGTRRIVQIVDFYVLVGLPALG